MDTTVEEILQNVTIPEDDGKLQQALAELDSKLAAWSGAIHHAQSTLKEAALSKETPAPSEPVMPKVQAPAPSPVVEKTVKVQEPPPPAEVPAAGPVSAEEDEALLATLDPETAKRIQVLRRLSGKNKSVRELIEQHHLTTSPSSPAQTNHKGFWRRQDK